MENDILLQQGLREEVRHLRDTLDDLDRRVSELSHDQAVLLWSQLALFGFWLTTTAGLPIEDPFDVPQPGQ